MSRRLIRQRALRRQRNIAFAIIAVIAVVAKIVQWNEINAVPPGRIDAMTQPPSPNGYDDFVAAERILESSPANATIWPSAEAGAGAIVTAEKLQSTVDANRDALQQIDAGLRLPVVGPKPLYRFDSSETPNGSSDSAEQRLLYLLEDDASLAARQNRWPDAAAKWCRALAFAESFPDLGPHYDWSYLKMRARNDCGRALFTIIPHLDRVQTVRVLACLEHEQKARPSQNRTLQVDKHNTDQALLVMFRDTSWRHKWAFWMPWPQNDPPLVKMALLSLKSDRTYLREYDAAANRMIAGAGTMQDLDLADVFIKAIWPNGQIIGDQTFIKLAAVGAALHEYSMDHGVYPSSLAQLAPNYLAELPTLPFTNASYNYAAFSTAPGGSRLDGCRLGETMTQPEPGGRISSDVLPAFTWEGNCAKTEVVH